MKLLHVTKPSGAFPRMWKNELFKFFVQYSWIWQLSICKTLKHYSAVPVILPAGNRLNRHSHMFLKIIFYEMISAAFVWLLLHFKTTPELVVQHAQLLAHSFSLTASLQTTWRGEWSRRNVSWIPGFTCCLASPCESKPPQQQHASRCKKKKKTQATRSFQHRWRQNKYCLPPTQKFK